MKLREYCPKSVRKCKPNLSAARDLSMKKEWVANGTRTRNSQNHNLELYH